MLEVYGFRLAYILYFQISQYHWSKADQFKSVRYPKMPDLRVSRVLAVLCFVGLFFEQFIHFFIPFQVMWKMLERKPRYTFFFLQKVRNHIVKETFFNLLPPNDHHFH